MAWFAVNTKTVSPSEVLAMTPAESGALRRSVSRILEAEEKAQLERDMALARLGGCAFRGGR